MKESALVQKIIKAVKETYPRAYVRKIADRFTRGIPDVMIVCPQRIDGGMGWFHHSFFLAVECKAEKGVQTMLQRLEGEEINAIPGALYIVARSVEEVLDVMKKQGAVP